MVCDGSNTPTAANTRETRQQTREEQDQLHVNEEQLLDASLSQATLAWPTHTATALVWAPSRHVGAGSNKCILYAVTHQFAVSEGWQECV
jgi:hypothetical protein